MQQARCSIKMNAEIEHVLSRHVQCINKRLLLDQTAENLMHRLNGFVIYTERLHLRLRQVRPEQHWPEFWQVAFCLLQFLHFRVDAEAPSHLSPEQHWLLRRHAALAPLQALHFRVD
jgi:hypothetical protein